MFEPYDLYDGGPEHGGPQGRGGPTVCKAAVLSGPDHGNTGPALRDYIRRSVESYYHPACTLGCLYRYLDLVERLRWDRDPKRRADLCERFDLDPGKRARAYSTGNRQNVWAWWSAGRTVAVRPASKSRDW